MKIIGVDIIVNKLHAQLQYTRKEWIQQQQQKNPRPEQVLSLLNGKFVYTAGSM